MGSRGKQQWGAAAILLLTRQAQFDKGPLRRGIAGFRPGRRNTSAKFCC
jgi:hypothetical protein